MAMSPSDLSQLVLRNKWDAAQDLHAKLAIEAAAMRTGS